jgi:serine/threonine-protein kinase HipA
MFGVPAGRLSVLKNGHWVFEYLSSFSENSLMPPISVSLPKNVTGPMEFASVPGFFDGLLPEGWLAERGENFGVFIGNKEDALAIYLKDAIGGVSLREEGIEKRVRPPIKIMHAAAETLVQKSPQTFLSEYLSEYEEEHRRFVNEKILLFAFEGVHRILSHRKCLICFLPLQKKKEKIYHGSCAKDVFGVSEDIIAATSLRTFSRDAFSSLSSGAPLPGYQPKAQFFVAHESSLGTELILKPDVIVDQKHKNAPRGIPIFEHLTMRAAEYFGLNVAKSAIIPFADGSLGYATRRFDRLPGIKIHMEDIHQALGRNQDLEGKDKFQGKLRDVARVMRQLQNHLAVSYSTLMREFARRTVFNLAIGNHDCHLKNHSVIYFLPKGKPWVAHLSPAYDLLPLNAIHATRHKGGREYALTINEKNRNITPKDVIEEFRSFGAHIEAMEAFDFLFTEKDKILSIFRQHLPMFGLEQHGMKLDQFITKRIKFLEVGFVQIPSSRLRKPIQSS